MNLNRFTENPLRTRADVQRLVRDLVAPVLPHFSPGRAAVRLGANRALYGDPAGLMEAYTRPLWGLVPLTAGGGQFEAWDLWRQGLDAGTDPEHPQFWGWPGDYDQRSVESAALGFALVLAPQEMWQGLAPAVKLRAAEWLRRINAVRLVDSNWLFFRVIVNLGLERCGQPAAPDQVQADLDRLDAFYLGNGWYTDGRTGAPFRDGHYGDYYIPMAFHFYALFYARIAGASDPVRAARYAERARLFAPEFSHYFAADGSGLPFGRSLTYRFAQGAFWGALAFNSIEALPWPVMKGIYLRHLRWWLSQPIFSESGLLTIGYAYPNLVMAESYNSSGSPYWALKAFLPLALPAEHPFWRAEEAPLPPRPQVRTVPGANLVLATVGAARDVAALNPGQEVEDWPRHAPQKYSKFAYSTRFGFCVPVSSATPQEGGLDSMLALSDDERRYRGREHAYDAEVKQGIAYSRWQPWSDVEVRTWLIAADHGLHVRVHWLQTPRPLWSIETGFAAPYTVRTSLVTSTPGPQRAEVQTPAGRSVLLNLAGERPAECVPVGASSHVLASLSAMPMVRGTHGAGEHWLACVVGGSSLEIDLTALAAQFTFHTDGETREIRREGTAWWTWRPEGVGESSAARLGALQLPV